MTDFVPQKNRTALQKQNDIDWVQRWNDLVIARNWKYEPKTETDFDYWQKNAHDYSRRVMSRWTQPDSTRDFLIAALQKKAGATLLDIGAGTGNWAIQLAPYLAHVTAIEPSAGMSSVFNEVLQEQKPAIENISLVNGKWPEVQTRPHDFTLCSHAMYGFADLRAALEKINQVTRDTCFLLIRAPQPNDPLARLARRFWGHPDDSPNFHVLYNACLQLGIYPNVLFEEASRPHPRCYESPDAALEDLRMRFHLAETDPGIDKIRSILAENLKQNESGNWMLAMHVKVALVYWKPSLNPILF